MHIDEILFKVAPDDLTDDHFIRNMYYRTKLPSVGDILEKLPRSRVTLRLDSIVKSFLLTVENLKINPAFKLWTPSLQAALALIRFRDENQNSAMPFDVYLAESDLPNNSNLLLEINLQEAACTLFGGVLLDGCNSVENMPSEIRCEMFKFAMGVYPLEKWTYEVWERYTPACVLDKEFALLHFKGNLNGRIHAIARSTGWNTLRDFCKHDRYKRFMLPNFGASGLEAVLLRLVELSSLNTPPPTLSSFTHHSVLELFALELNENPRIKDRWRQALRWRTGFEGKPKTYSWIAGKLEISRGRAKIICDLGWKMIRFEEPWQTLIIMRLEDVYKELVGRLTLEILEDEEPWFRGVASTPSFFNELISVLSDGKFEIACRSKIYFVRKSDEKRKPLQLAKEP